MWCLIERSLLLTCFSIICGSQRHRTYYSWCASRAPDERWLCWNALGWAVFILWTAKFKHDLSRSEKKRNSKKVAFKEAHTNRSGFLSFDKWSIVAASLATLTSIYGRKKPGSCFRCQILIVNETKAKMPLMKRVCSILQPISERTELNHDNPRQRSRWCKSLSILSCQVPFKGRAGNDVDLQWTTSISVHMLIELHKLPIITTVIKKLLYL